MSLVREFRLREFRRADLARLYELDQICFPPEVAYSLNELRYFLTHPRCFALVAYEEVVRQVIAAAESRISGFIIVQRTRYLGAPAGRVITLDVDPAMRRTGLGTMLMEAAEVRLLEEQATAIKLEVAENNVTAKKFYTQRGFEVIESIPNYYPGDINAEVMLKKL